MYLFSTSPILPGGENTKVKGFEPEGKETKHEQIEMKINTSKDIYETNLITAPRWYGPCNSHTYAIFEVIRYTEL